MVDAYVREHGVRATRRHALAEQAIVMGIYHARRKRGVKRAATSMYVATMKRYEFVR